MATQSQALGPKHESLVVRRATPADAEVCGRICYEAFSSLSTRHNFPSDFPAPEIPVAVLSTMFSHPGFFCVVAELNGKLIGSNCLDERTPIAGVGPVSIDPAEQNRAAGRQLMQAVMARAAERKFAGIRLVQAAYHNRSLSLYAKLGFVVREPLACMQGPAIHKTPPGYRVRAAQAGDLGACNDLCLRVHGHDRGGELNDAIQQGTAVIAELEGRVRAYASSLGFFGHAVGESNEDLQTVIAAAGELRGPGILVPTRNAALFRWCLENFACGPAADVDDDRPLQRTGWRILAFRFVLRRFSDLKSEKRLLTHGHWQTEVVAHLDETPATRALIFASWPKPEHGLGFPARAFAILP